MKPDISIGKEEKGDVQIFTANPMPQPTPTVAPRRNRQKYVCASVAVVIVIAMVIGGFFGAMHLMHKNTVRTFEKTLKDAAGELKKEIIKVDEDKETATFEGTDDANTQFKLILDYKHSVSISRLWMNKKKEPACYIAHMNKDGFPTPHEMASILDKQTEEENMDIDPRRESFSVDLDPIEDISFLGDEVEAMCQGLKAYWAFPKQDVNPTKRKRRDTDHENDDAFHPNVTIDCPLPQWGFLSCEQITRSNCTFDCCEWYYCYRFLISAELGWYYHYCYYGDCTKTVTKDPCHCVYSFQYIIPEEE